MSSIWFRIPNVLLIPFACPKWEIEQIKVEGVTTHATFFRSSVPCAHINKAEKAPLVLSEIIDVWPFDWKSHVTGESAKALDRMKFVISEFGNLGTKHERLFVEFYFDYLQHLLRQFSKRDQYPQEHHIFDALLPLPQAHLYAHDPLNDAEAGMLGEFRNPSSMFKVDFVFWTGEKLVAVEIDGGSHIGNPAHIRKDRLLSLAGVQTVHITNQELDTFGPKVVQRLLPPDLTHFWDRGGYIPMNPLDPSLADVLLR